MYTVFQTPPDNVDLNTLANVKTNLNISSSADDNFLQESIARASSLIEVIVGRPLLRAEYLDKTRGSGLTRLLTRARPLMEISSITYNGSVQTPDSFEVSNQGAGFIYRNDGGIFTDAYGPNVWQVVYTAGYFVPDDDVSQTITVQASDNSYNGTGFPTHLKPNDLLNASSFSNAANNGLKQVVTATSSKITVLSPVALVDGSESATLTFSNLPAAVTRSIDLLVAEAYHARERDPTLKSETIFGAWSASWSQAGTLDTLKQVRKLLAPMRRAV